MKYTTRALAALIMTALVAGCGGGSGGGPTSPGNPTISINDVSVAEGQNAVFTVTVSPTSSSAVTFNYSTANGTATAPGDYTAAVALSGSVAANASTTTITIATIDDASAEAAETFTVTLSSISGADLGDVSGTGTIQASDGGVAVSFATDILPILNAHCASCHSIGTNGGLNMGNPITWNGVRNGSGNNGPIVVAGNALSSNLYTKTTASPPFGARMPVGGPFLSTADQIKIRDWINLAALNN